MANKSMTERIIIANNHGPIRIQGNVAPLPKPKILMDS